MKSINKIKQWMKDMDVLDRFEEERNRYNFMQGKKKESIDTFLRRMRSNNQVDWIFKNAFAWNTDLLYGIRFWSEIDNEYLKWFRYGR